MTTFETYFKSLNYHSGATIRKQDVKDYLMRDWTQSQFDNALAYAIDEFWLAEAETMNKVTGQLEPYLGLVSWRMPNDMWMWDKRE